MESMKQEIGYMVKGGTRHNILKSPIEIFKCLLFVAD